VERLDDILKCAKVVEVVSVDIENNRYIGEKLEKVVLEFARLANEDIACAGLSASADTWEFSADIC
jgi:hypothetical protein